jgi:hypothetical protein
MTRRSQEPAQRVTECSPGWSEAEPGVSDVLWRQTFEEGDAIRVIPSPPSLLRGSAALRVGGRENLGVPSVPPRAHFVGLLRFASIIGRWLRSRPSPTPSPLRGIVALRVDNREMVEIPSVPHPELRPGCSTYVVVWIALSKLSGWGAQRMPIRGTTYAIAIPKRKHADAIIPVAVPPNEAGRLGAVVDQRRWRQHGTRRGQTLSRVPWSGPCGHDRDASPNDKRNDRTEERRVGCRATTWHSPKPPTRRWLGKPTNTI